MKKVMMTAFAVVLAAGMASAANLQWSIARNFVTNGNLPEGKNWADVGTEKDLTYALVLSTDLSVALGLITNVDGSFIATIGNNANAVFLDWGNKTAGNTNGAMDLQAGNSDKITTSSANYVAIAFMQLEGTWYYTYSAPAVGVGYVTDPDLGTAPAFTGSLFTAGMGAWGVIAPEPVSAALLALGLAAVGLRRRFRK